jgi:uncharacterized protein YggE
MTHTRTAILATAALAAVAAAGCSGGSNGAAKNTVAAQETAATLTSGTGTSGTGTSGTGTNGTGATGPTVNVSGHGKVEGTPDVMTVTMGVQTTDPSAQAALARNNERANALVGALKQRGVAAKDIQTVDLNVSPNFDKNFRVTGYSASNTVTAKLRDLAKAGQVIDAAALTAGPDIRLQGVTFSIDDTSALVARARADAVKDALAQGKQLAAAAGVKLGAIRTIDDTGVQVPQPYYNLRLGATTSAQDSAVPLEPGSQQIGVDVVVVFDITR